jgi:hypothetical protein
MFFSVYSNRCLLPTRLSPKIAGKAVLKQKHLNLKKKNRTCLFAGPISIRCFVMFPHIWRPASELLHLGGYRHDEFGKLFRHVVGFVGFGVSPLNLIFLQTVP